MALVKNYSYCTISLIVLLTFSLVLYLYIHDVKIHKLIIMSSSKLTKTGNVFNLTTKTQIPNTLEDFIKHINPPSEVEEAEYFLGNGWVLRELSP